MYDLSKILITFCLFGIGITINAQIVIPASGGNASGGGATVTYSIGQIVYTRNTGSNGSVAQGIQQPIEISVVTSIGEAKNISLELSVYPNPAIDFIILKIENYEVEILRYQLYDINGNILLSNKTDGNETNIPMRNYLPSTYILKIIHGNKEIKTFKIIKH